MPLTPLPTPRCLTNAADLLDHRSAPPSKRQPAAIKASGRLQRATISDASTLLDADGRIGEMPVRPRAQSEYKGHARVCTSTERPRCASPRLQRPHSSAGGSSVKTSTAAQQRRSGPHLQHEAYARVILSHRLPQRILGVVADPRVVREGQLAESRVHRKRRGQSHHSRVLHVRSRQI